MLGLLVVRFQARRRHHERRRVMKRYTGPRHARGVPMIAAVDCVVLGAGVVGMAIARACAQSGLETLVLEAESAIGTGTSARNSEVIHAGLYYPRGSLKARLCVQGRHAL